MDDIAGIIIATFIIGLGIVGIVAVFKSFFTVHTKQAAIVERLGKFNRVALPGLNWKIPFLESKVYVEDLSMQLMDVEVASKTQDDATVTIPVRVQYYVLPDKVKEAYYELDDPEDQINAHVENVILSYIPKLNLDDTYLQEDKIAERIKENLQTVMSKFGYAIENALVTKIVPDAKVTAAMNAINAARREKVATEAKAEANKIILVKNAEAQCDAQILQGKGVAGERQAIVDGLRTSVLHFEEGVRGVTSKDVMALVMMTQYLDAIKAIGVNNTTILMPHSPAAVTDFMQQMRDAVITSNLVTNPPEPKAS
jgi:regulator of protease activity HflC (stomatin/prohibitin superfamily)